MMLLLRFLASIIYDSNMIISIVEASIMIPSQYIIYDDASIMITSSIDCASSIMTTSIIYDASSIMFTSINNTSSDIMSTSIDNDTSSIMIILVWIRIMLLLLE